MHWILHITDLQTFQSEATSKLYKVQSGDLPSIGRPWGPISDSTISDSSLMVTFIFIRLSSSKWLPFLLLSANLNLVHLLSWHLVGAQWQSVSSSYCLFSRDTFTLHFLSICYSISKWNPSSLHQTTKDCWHNHQKDQTKQFPSLSTWLHFSFF